MHRFYWVAGVCLACIPTFSFAQSTTSTESYSYDALGRLIEVEVSDGEQDGAKREYDYDNADNRTQVISVAGANTGSNGPQQLPAECALNGSEMPSLTDIKPAWPRVGVDAACDEDLTIGYTLEHQSGGGTWTDLGFNGFTGTDPVLEASLPKNETVKLVYIQPGAGSVPLGTQLELKVNWNVQNFSGPGTTAESTVRVDGTCTLGPVGFTTMQSGYAWPRVYAPSSAGCGYEVKLGYTITVASGQVTSGELDTIVQGLIFADDDTLDADEHGKVLIVPPIAGVVATPDQVVLHINWTTPDSNALIASPGYSIVTINPD